MLKVVQVEIGQVSYLPGDDFTLVLRFERPEGLDGVSNVSTDLFRAERGRNQFTFGFGSKPQVDGDTLTVTQKLPIDLQPGVHMVGASTLVLGNGDKLQQVTFGPLIFAIRCILDAPLTSEALDKRVADLSQERQAYAQKEMITASAVGDPTRKPYRVLVFGVGCLLHARQQLGGFVIAPLQRGLSSARMQEIVESTFKHLGLKPLKYDAEVERQHEQATPTFLVEYWRVLGLSHDDALAHCRRHADLMFDLLGLDRGQKPREFYCIAIDQATGEGRQSYSVPGYRGNMISDFNPVSTANLIEVVTPRLAVEPFLRLLVRSYAEATAEQDPGIAFLRTWTILELLADRAIPKGQRITHFDGSSIFNEKGNPMDTNGKVARVYEFIRQSGPVRGYFVSNIDGTERRLLVEANEENEGYTPGTRLICLWDIIRAGYAIRNCVAHEGHFSVDHIDRAKTDQVLAADVIQNTPLDLFRWIRDRAELAVRRELHRT